MTARRWNLRDAGLGFLVTVASVATVEGGLWILGVQPAVQVASSRGFDPHEDYLRPDPTLPGHWRTALDLPAIDKLSIPPKGDALRVLLMGGSNTRGFREQILEEALEAGSGREFEVFNLGRPGYGSTRVAVLLDQALAVLEADVVVLYTGHNEFVERSFRAELESWEGSGTRLAAGLAQRLRCVRLLRDVAAGRRPRRQDDPYAWVLEYGKFIGLPYAETRAEFEAYAANLRRMVEAAGARGARVVLSTVVFNRFSRPRIATLEEVSSRERTSIEARLRAARGRYPAAMAPLLPGSASERVHMAEWGRTHGDVAADLPGLRPLTGPLEGVAPTFFTGNWSPRVDELYAALAWLGAERSADERAALQDSAADLDAVLATAQDHSRALFERALVAWALGERGASVRRRFEDAARFDRAPRRATPLSNDHVRETAATFPDALLVDLDEHFRSTTDDGLVGWEVMTDHCHLGPLAGEHAMRVFAAAILERWYTKEER